VDSGLYCEYSRTAVVPVSINGFLKKRKIEMSTRNATVWVTVVIILVLCVQARAELVAHWQFEEGQGGIAYDSAGEDINAPAFLLSSIRPS
jgi:hypothetical protein